MAKVLKAFNTVNRRFAPGAEVTEADLHEHPLDLGALAAGGFVEGESPAVALIAPSRARVLEPDDHL